LKSWLLEDRDWVVGILTDRTRRQEARQRAGAEEEKVEKMAEKQQVKDRNRKRKYERQAAARRDEELRRNLDRELAERRWVEARFDESSDGSKERRESPSTRSKDGDRYNSIDERYERRQERRYGRYEEERDTRDSTHTKGGGMTEGIQERDTAAKAGGSRRTDPRRAS